ncbi:MAG: type II secretion system F family protein [Desulfobacteraceae bacterium]|nr:type II secretion system F family protein [Desulfobacteraceae bacterium]
MDSIVFFTVSGLTFLVCQYIEQRYRKYVLAKRFAGSEPLIINNGKTAVSPRLNKLAQSLGRVAAPKNGKDISRITEQLSLAGYRDEDSVTLFYGFKLGFGLILASLVFAELALTANFTTKSPLMLFIPFGMGYFLPDTVLKKRVKARLEKIFQELPDTLDLLVVCLHAGLGLDYALFRVCNELKEIAPTLSQEFERYFLETKSGIERNTAFENLARRNGSEPLKSVVNVLLQSAKIGTDMAQALKNHTDTMRRERQQMAEEQGAKLATKLTLPLVIFILPALMLIILGPVIINFISLVNDGF